MIWILDWAFRPKYSFDKWLMKYFNLFHVSYQNLSSQRWQQSGTFLEIKVSKLSENVNNTISSPCLIFLKGNYFQNDSINFHTQNWPSAIFNSLYDDFSRWSEKKKVQKNFCLVVKVVFIVFLLECPTWNSIFKLTLTSASITAFPFLPFLLLIL